MFQVLSKKLTDLNITSHFTGDSYLCFPSICSPLNGRIHPHLYHFEGNQHLVTPVHHLMTHCWWHTPEFFPTTDLLSELGATNGAHWGATLPETNSLPLKIGLPKSKVVFQPSIFRGELLVLGRVDIFACPKPNTNDILGGLTIDFSNFRTERDVPNPPSQ